MSSEKTVENCRCGCEPVCEPGRFGFKDWDVCCLNCATRTPVFHNRSEAIQYWNNLVRNSPSATETDAASQEPGRLRRSLLKPFRKESVVHS